MRFDRGHFVSAVLGGLVVAVIMAAMPAVAGNGDNLRLGRKNYATQVTLIKGKGGVLIRNTTPAGEPAAWFEVKSGPPFAVNSTSRVDNLNADLLDGRSANSLTRATWCTSVDAADGVDYGCTMTITAPVAGYLLMSGSVDFWTSTPGGDLLSCMFKEGVTEVPGSRRDIDIQMPGNQESDCATDAAVYVTPGEHSITFATQSVGANTNLGSVGAYILYVPFNGAGALPKASP